MNSRNSAGIYYLRGRNIWDVEPQSGPSSFIVKSWGISSKVWYCEDLKEEPQCHSNVFW